MPSSTWWRTPTRNTWRAPHEALWKARDAIRRAAKELKDHLKGVDWQGESGTAFRAFGTGLVAHAEKLGDFADAAGTQITVMRHRPGVGEERHAAA